MEPLALHIGGASTGLPLAASKGPLPPAAWRLPDAPSAPGDASDDEIGVDDLLAFGGVRIGAVVGVRDHLRQFVGDGRFGLGLRRLALFVVILRLRRRTFRFATGEGEFQRNLGDLRRVVDVRLRDIVVIFVVIIASSTPIPKFVVIST